MRVVPGMALPTVVADERAARRLAPPAAGEAHLWWADLDAGADTVRRLSPFLSDDELDRASAFRFARDRRRFVVGRGILRELLGAYLEVEPASVRFAYGSHGKPRLDGTELSFNLSHSGARALYAFGGGLELGVDVEVLRVEPDFEQVAETVFSARELTELRALPGPARAHAFLRGWTRKEAIVKGCGDGLSMPLQSFDVTLCPPGAAEPVERAQQIVRGWRLYDLSRLCPGHAAALAARRGIETIVGKEWRDHSETIGKEHV